RAEQAERRQIWNQFGGESAGLVVADDARHAPLLDELAHAGANRAFFVVKQAVPADELLQLEDVVRHAAHTTAEGIRMRACATPSRCSCGPPATRRLPAWRA